MKHFKKIVLFIIICLLIILWFVFHPRAAISHADEFINPKGLMSADVVLRYSAPLETEVLLDWEVLKRIKKCESGGIATSTSSTGAKGLYQFIRGTWVWRGKELWGDRLKDKDPYNPKDNEELARYVFINYGTGDWDESKSCWGR